MARMTVLGGSAAGGNTGAGCSGYLVQSTQQAIVLDLGPGTLLELRRHTDYRALGAIVISHLHVDHVLDLVALRYALAYNPIKPESLMPLWMPPGGRAFLDQVGRAFGDAGNEREFFPSVFAVNEFDPAKTLKIGDVTITFAPTVHYVPCWAMRLAFEGAPAGDLLYTADTGPAADLAAFGDGSAVVIAEATLIGESGEPFDQRGHLTAAEAGNLADRVGASRLVLTHLWEEVGFDRARDQAATRFRGTIEIARPGLTVEW